MISSAIFDASRTYRYRLSRVWNDSLSADGFIMLNPSTADEFQDDATIRKCVGFAQRWGYGGVEVGNLYAMCSSDPSALIRASAPVGSENDQHLCELASSVSRVVVAWGNGPDPLSRAAIVPSVLHTSGVPVFCLGFTSMGRPKHPGRIAYSVALSEFARSAD